MDASSYLIICMGLVGLLGRVVSVVLQQRRITEALTQHHEKKPQPPSIITAKYLELSQFVETVPVKLRIGLSIGALSALVGLAPLALRRMLPEALLPDGTLSRTLWLTAKWLVLGAGLQAMRKWGTQQMRKQRDEAHGAG